MNTSVYMSIIDPRWERLTVTVTLETIQRILSAFISTKSSWWLKTSRHSMVSLLSASFISFRWFCVFLISDARHFLRRDFLMNQFEDSMEYAKDVVFNSKLNMPKSPDTKFRTLNDDNKLFGHRPIFPLFDEKNHISKLKSWWYLNQAT